MDDETYEEVVIEPMRHNRWAIIVPALDLMANIVDEIGTTMKNYAILAAQHGMQAHYDQRFESITKEP